MKRVAVELRCKFCGNLLVFIPPPAPCMADPRPLVAITVQPCKRCIEARAQEIAAANGDSWENLQWLTCIGSQLEVEQ